MSIENVRVRRIATLENDAADVATERALMDLEIPVKKARRHRAARRRARVVVGSTCVAAAVLATGTFVTFAQQQRTPGDRIAAQAVPMVPEALPRVRAANVRDVVLEAPVLVGTPVLPTSGTDARSPRDAVQPSRSSGLAHPARQVPDAVDDYRFLVDEDRCGGDPTCGI